MKNTKNIILTFFLLIGFLKVSAQQPVTISGTFARATVPFVNEQITITFSSLDSTLAVLGYDTVYTDSNGFYLSNFVVPGSMPHGFAIIKSSDCSGGVQENYMPYFPGFYNLTLDLECVNFCQSTFYYTVDSIPGMGLLANLYANSKSTTASYNWTFGDGTSGTGMNPTHMYNSTGTYNVCLTVTDSINSCTYTYCDSVVVANYLNICTASFNYYQDSLNANLITFSGQSGSAPGSIITWDFGDGYVYTGSNYVTHLYANSGIYNVCFGYFDILQNCFTTYCDIVYVGSGIIPNCSAEFKMFLIPDSLNQGSNLIYFANTIQNPTSTYEWDFGDGNFGSGPFVTHSFNTIGIYDVCSYISDSALGCTDTVCKRIEIVNGGMRILLGLENQKSISINTVYPNPAQDKANISLNSLKPGVAKIKILSLDGRVMEQFNTSIEQGNNTIELKLTGLNSGMYFVEINNSNDRATTKLIVN